MANFAAIRFAVKWSSILGQSSCASGAPHGFQTLARFVGDRFRELYRDFFWYTYLPLRDKTSTQLARAVIESITRAMP